MGLEEKKGIFQLEKEGYGDTPANHPVLITPSVDMNQNVSAHLISRKKYMPVKAPFN